MALLAGLMRQAAITGRTDTFYSWWGGRQGGRWAQQTARAILPTAPPPPTDRAKALQSLTELHDSGIVTDAELERLRTRLGL
jgi:hypothetical protein